MYKDKEKQKEADRERSRRYRQKQKGVTDSGCDAQGVTKANKAGPKSFEDLPADVQRTIESMASGPEDKQARIERAIRYQQLYPSPHSRGIGHGHIDLPSDYKTADQLKPGEHNRVSKPGDPDYSHDKGQCHTCDAKTQIKSITKCHKCIDSKELVSA